ncbi:hypothetical protein EVAR_62842_1 [Eumeta japonica]|uniref:Uncharacterized protein n=1 Tax=Eumeta variegata TaxID=151549 RepID=A0A4C1ZHM0_EUMVA|nr:hypothetical protein EVAR_62842_1 [Eumeta japonica]
METKDASVFRRRVRIHIDIHLHSCKIHKLKFSVRRPIQSTQWNVERSPVIDRLRRFNKKTLSNEIFTTSARGRINHRAVTAPAALNV